MSKQQTKQADRAAELIESVDQFTRDHHAWVNDVNREHPDAAYWDALTDMLDVWEAGEIPAECRSLQPHVDELAVQLDIFDAESSTSGSIQPNADFWEARQQLEQARIRRDEPKKHRESVSELSRQGVTHEQIASMWGLTFGQVEQEIQRPGSVVGPDYIHPEDRQQRAKTENLPTAGAKTSTPHAGPRRRVASKMCTESARELWALGQGAGATPISYDQAADMLGCTIAEVEAQFRLFDDESAEAKRRTAAGENEVENSSKPSSIQQTTDNQTDNQTTSQQPSQKPSQQTSDEPAELAGKSNDELIALMGQLGIGIRAKASRNTMIKKIMAAMENQTAGA